MTPKEKAIELMLEYHKLIEMNTVSFAKQCALIAVDEILDIVQFDKSNVYAYWQEVKQEIEKL